MKRILFSILALATAVATAGVLFAQPSFMPYPTVVQYGSGGYGLLDTTQDFAVGMTPGGSGGVLIGAGGMVDAASTVQSPAYTGTWVGEQIDAAYLASPVDTNYLDDYLHIPAPIFYAPFDDPDDPLKTYAGGTLTMVRVGDTATYLHPTTGYVAAAAANELRIEADGALIEGARENTILQSRNLDATWYDVTSSAQDETGIDGAANTAWTSEDDNAAGYEYFLQDVTIANDNATHCVSIFIKKDSDETRFPKVGLGLQDGTIQQIRVKINTKTGASSVDSSTGTTSHGVVDFNDDWWRVYIVVTNNSTGNVTARLDVYPAWSATLGGAGDNTLIGSVVIDGAQFEQNASFPSSVIFTTVAAVTRNADVLSFVATGNIPRDTDPGTTVFDYRVSSIEDSSRRHGFHFDDSGFGRLSFRGVDAGPSSSWAYGDSGVTYSLDSDPPTANTTIKVGITYGPNGGTAFRDGTERDSNANASDLDDGITTVYIGSNNGSTVLFGHIQNFRIFDFAATDAQMVYMTTYGPTVAYQPLNDYLTDLADGTFDEPVDMDSTLDVAGTVTVDGTVDGVDLAAHYTSSQFHWADTNVLHLPPSCPDDDSAIYDTTTSTWICSTVAGGGGGTTYNAGDGLALTGTTFSADASTNIVVTSGGISVDDSPSFGGSVSAPNFVSTATSNHHINVNNTSAPTGTFLGVGDIYTLNGEPYVAVDGTVKSLFYHSTNLIFGTNLTRTGNTLVAAGGGGTTYWTRSNAAVWPTNAGDSLGTANTVVGNAYLNEAYMASAVQMAGEAGTAGWYTRLDVSGNVYLGDPSGGTVNSFVTWNVDNGTDPVADSSTDTIILTSGTNIAITGSATADSIEIAITGEVADANVVNDITLETTKNMSITKTSPSILLTDTGAGHDDYRLISVADVLTLRNMSEAGTTIAEQWEWQGDGDYSILEGNLIVSNDTDGAAYVRLYEDEDDGFDSVYLQAPTPMASNATVTLPSSTGTLALTSGLFGGNFSDLSGSITNAQTPDNITILASALSGDVTSAQIAVDMARDTETATAVSDHAALGSIHVPTNCTGGQRPSWNNTTTQWICADDASGGAPALDAVTALTADSTIINGTFTWSLDMTSASDVAISTDGTFKADNYATSVADGGRFLQAINTNNTFTTEGFLAYDNTDNEYQYYDNDSLESVASVSDLPATATSVAEGIAEHATIAETNTGTAQDRTVTPSGLENWTGSGQIVTVGTLTGGNVDAAVTSVDDSDLPASMTANAHAITTLTVNTSIIIGGDTVNELAGEGLTVTSNNLDIDANIRASSHSAQWYSPVDGDNQIWVFQAQGAGVVTEIECFATGGGTTINVYKNSAVDISGATFTCTSGTWVSDTTLTNTTIADNDSFYIDIIAANSASKIFVQINYTE